MPWASIPTATAGAPCIIIARPMGMSGLSMRSVRDGAGLFCRAAKRRILFLVLGTLIYRLILAAAGSMSSWVLT